MKYFLIFILIISLLLVSTGGFYDAKEVAHTVSVIAMGIDKGENMNLRVSFQIERTNGGKSDGGENDNEGKKEKNKDLITVEAPTILSAFARANSINSVDLSIGNVKMVVLSEELCHNGVFEVIKELATAIEFKNNAYLTVALGKAEDVLKNVKPEDEEYISVYYEQIIFRHYKKATRYFLLSETYFSLLEDGDFLLPLVSKRDEDGFLYDYKDDTNSNLSAGMIPKESKHKVEFLGGAVFSKGILKGILNEEEMLSASFIMGFFATRDMSIEYPFNSGEYVTLALEQQYLSDINVKTKEPMVVQIKIKLRGNYEFIPKGDYEKFNEDFLLKLENEIKNDAKKLFMKCINDYDSDIFGIKKEAKKNFLTNKDFESYNIDEKIKTAEIKVLTMLELERSGRFTFE